MQVGQTHDAGWLSGYKDELEVMKAKAGYKMVENIPTKDGPIKLLHLTNKQALGVTKDDIAMRRILAELCGKKESNPGLIIKLAQSLGFREFTNFFNGEDAKCLAGMQYDTGPFLKIEDQHKTIARLDNFMREVVIPLAEQTSAIVICNAIPGQCALSDSFTRMTAFMSSEPRFSLVGVSKRIGFLYHNSDTNAKWQEIRENSNVWKERELMFKQEGLIPGPGDLKPLPVDLNWKIKKFILFEGFDIQDKPSDEGKIALQDNLDPPIRFISSLMNHYVHHGTRVLAIKTGACMREGANEQVKNREDSSYRMLIEYANSGIHVLCIDIRKRDAHLRARDQQKRIDLDVDAEGDVTVVDNNAIKPKKKGDKDYLDIKSKFITEMYRMVGENWEGTKICETLDCCMLAYLDSLLENLGAKADKTESKNLVSAIEAATKKEGIDENNSHVQVDYVRYAFMFARHFYLNLLPHWTEHQDQSGQRESLTFNNENEESVDQKSLTKAALIDNFGSEIQTTTSFAMQLLSSKRFYSINIWTPYDDQATLVCDIFANYKKNMELKGLKLLKEAWDEVDTVKWVADKYKVRAKWIYLLELFLGFLVTFFSVLSANLVQYRKILQSVTLACSLFLAASVSLETMFSPRVYWQQLRNAQVSLESVIWEYRMRVGRFKNDTTNQQPGRPEEYLCQALDDWRDHLMSGANNASATGSHGNWITEKEKKRFRSCADVNVNYGKNVDNHYKRLRGDDYIQHRLENIIQRYEQKIPNSLIGQYWSQLTVIFFGVIIAFLAEIGQVDLVTILNAIVAGLTSWIAFREPVTKADLYSSAIIACKMQKSQWLKLSKFEKINRVNTTEMVEETEKIILQVVASWSTTILDKQASAKKKQQTLNNKKQSDNKGDTMNPSSNDEWIDNV